jgi:hypothetical protein
VQTCAISNDLQRFTMAAEGQGARKQHGYGSCVRTIRGRREPLRAQKTGIYRDASRRRAKAALRIAARVLNQQRSATIYNARRCRAASEPRRGEEAIQVLASLGGPAHPASSDSATICNDLQWRSAIASQRVRPGVAGAMTGSGQQSSGERTGAWIASARLRRSQ